jgi:NTE family protein
MMVTRQLKTEEMNKQKVALVLSSGGARGLAHVGVIEGLEANGFEIASIAGSSMGALIGAFKACGELETYKNWACNLDRLDVFKLIDFTFSVNGFIRGEKVFKAMEEVIPDREIETFDLPFVAVATDLKNKREQVMSTGSMYRALKASVAIPTVVKPVVYGEQKLIDGGVLNPIPVNRVDRTEGDILVISNVNSPKPYTRLDVSRQQAEKEERDYLKMINTFKSSWAKLLPGGSSNDDKLGYFELLNRSIDLMQDRMTELLLEQYHPEIHAEISRDACNTFEFYRAEELINAGREAIEEAIQLYQVGDQ